LFRKNKKKIKMKKRSRCEEEPIHYLVKDGDDDTMIKGFVYVVDEHMLHQCMEIEDGNAVHIYYYDRTAHTCPYHSSPLQKYCEAFANTYFKAGPYRAALTVLLCFKWAPKEIRKMIARFVYESYTDKVSWFNANEMYTKHMFRERPYEDSF
jgi:hypothetical protein